MFTVVFEKMANFLLPDYGIPDFIMTRHFKKMLLYKCTFGNDQYYVFRKSHSTPLSGGGISESYRCIECEKADARIVGSTVIRNDRIVKNPQVGHNRDCTPLTQIKVDALQIKREMKLSCRN